jgi:hypothetical protein
MSPIQFSLSSNWGSGFTASMMLTNTTSNPWNGWTLEFDAAFSITHIWNAEVVSRQGNRYVIRGLHSNTSVQPGRSISFGFNGSNAVGTEIQPTNYSINGTSLTQATPTATVTSTPTPTPVAAPMAASTSTPLPTLSINDVSVVEKDSGTNSATFTVSLSRSSTSPISVRFATANGTAIAGSDFNARSGTLNFAAGQTSRTVSVSVQGDLIPEIDEDFFLRLSNPTNATIAKFEGRAIILDNDTPLPTLSVDPISFTEGNDGITFANFVVTLSESSSRQITVNFATANGTATAGSDYTATNGTLTFVPGVTSRSISIPILGDTIYEGNETFTLRLSNPVNATIANSQATATILNDDPLPSSDISNLQQGQFNYGEALQKSFLFYEAQRSGPLPANQRIEWRGDSSLNDGADVGIDLTGGYHDAGDHIKFGFPMASSMTLLSWGVVEYRDAYQSSGQLDEVLDAIKWGTNYLLKAHKTDSNGKTTAFWGQVGTGELDHAYWGKPENMKMARPAFKIDRQKPGSDLAGEAAAALAAASIIFRPTNQAYADRLLQNAEQLFEFADTYRGRYSNSIPQADTYYRSGGFMDELTWAAAWLHKATDKTSYLTKAENYYYGISHNWTHNWDLKDQGATVLLAQTTGKDYYKNQAEKWLNYWSNDNGTGVKHTPGGLAWLTQWGPLRYSANTSFIAGIYSDTVRDYNQRYAKFAESQIDYILGDNPNNFSYMVGFGDKYPLRPHHRAAHDGSWGTFDSSTPNKNILYGALVGGPSSPNDSSYVDSRSNYITNEVGLDYNAGLTGALAWMYSNYGGTPLSNQQLDSLPGIGVPNV